MKTTDPEKTTTNLPIQKKEEQSSFFSKEGKGSFFSNKKQNDDTPFFSPATLQPKLIIGQPNDKYEHEADTMADKVVSQINAPNSTPNVQRKCETCDADEHLQKIEEEENTLSLKKESLQRKPIFESNDDDVPSNTIQRKCASCEQEEGKIQAKSMGGEMTASPSLQNQLNSTKGSGYALPDATRNSMESSIGADFSGVRVHTDHSAVQMSKELGAQAFTHGSDVYFNEGEYDTGSSGGQHLLAHELTHVVQQGGREKSIQKHPVIPTPVDRKTRDNIFGIAGVAAGGGMTLDQFISYSERQADWFTEATLTTADRQALWSLIFKVKSDNKTLSGVGDIEVKNLTGVTISQWIDLDHYCKGTHSGSNTVRIAPSGNLTHRIAIGHTLKVLETKIPDEVLEIVMTQSELEHIQSSSTLGDWVNYWDTFHPHIQNASETQTVIDLLTGAGITPYIVLLGRVRSIHRFPKSTLDKLVVNFGDTSQSKPFYLVLFTSTDYNSGFLNSIDLFKNLIEEPTKLVLMLEGQATLNSIITEIPVLTATYGKVDSGGTPKIAQAMIAGHGSNRSVELAGTGTPYEHGGEIYYPTRGGGLDLDSNLIKTQQLLEALLDNLDPATARIVYAGCLVGSNEIPLNDSSGATLSEADMLAHLNNPANQNLVDFTNQLATSKGMGGTVVEGARASVALGSATSLMDGAGNMHLEYPYDPDALADAASYAATGREPEGLLRAALEVALKNDPIVAANLLRSRLGVTYGGWLDTCAKLFAGIAVDGVAAGSPIDMVKLNKLAHMVDPILLCFWASRSVSTFKRLVNVHPTLAETVYTEAITTAQLGTPSSDETKRGRFMLEQSWSLLKNARIVDMITYLDTYTTLSPEELELNIDTGSLASISNLIFPVGAAASSGRARLALAWFERDKSNADVRAFLDGQVDNSGTTPILKPAIKTHLSNPAADERSILINLGRLNPPARGGGRGGGAALDRSNADVFPNVGPTMNDVRVVPDPHLAIIIAPAHVLNVRTKPNMSGTPFHWLNRGDNVNVMGFVHNWAAVDINGRLGFAYKKFLAKAP